MAYASWALLGLEPPRPVEVGRPWAMHVVYGSTLLALVYAPTSGELKYKPSAAEMAAALQAYVRYAKGTVSGGEGGAGAHGSPASPAVNPKP